MLVTDIYMPDTKEMIDVANNGVMMGCDSEKGGTFDLVAWPSADRPSGMTPTTDDAKTYEGNLLVLKKEAPPSMNGGGAYFYYVRFISNQTRGFSCRARALPYR